MDTFIIGSFFGFSPHNFEQVFSQYISHQRQEILHYVLCQGRPRGEDAEAVLKAKNRLHFLQESEKNKKKVIFKVFMKFQWFF